MSNLYKKYASTFKCPLCGKFNCKYYGSGKSSKKIAKRKIRKIFKEVEDD